MNKSKISKSNPAPQKLESRFKKVFDFFRRNKKKPEVVERHLPKGRFGRQVLRGIVRRSISYQWGSMYKQSRVYSYPESISGFPRRNRNYRRSKYNGKGQLI